MGERSLGRGGLLRLAKELSDELNVAEAIADEVCADAANLLGLRGAERLEDPIARGATAVLALGIHRWYSAIEAMLERIERAFGTLPDGPEWHTDLLTGATSEIPEVRPPILGRDPLVSLRELLKFRHFLRHAYAVELDSARLLVLAEHVDAARGLVSDGLSAFADALRAMARALGD